MFGIFPDTICNLILYTFFQRPRDASLASNASYGSGWGSDFDSDYYPSSDSYYPETVSYPNNADQTLPNQKTIGNTKSPLENKESNKYFEYNNTPDNERIYGNIGVDSNGNRLARTDISSEPPVINRTGSGTNKPGNNMYQHLKSVRRHQEEGVYATLKQTF